MIGEYLKMTSYFEIDKEWLLWVSSQKKAID